MKTIQSLHQLGPDELARIRRTLIDRYDVGSRGNIVEIGFGVALLDDQIDPARGDAICFYVTNKRMPRAKEDRIPKREAVRVKRGKHFVLVNLATDVIITGRNGFQLSGRPIRHLTDSATATAGAIVAWRFTGGRRFAWGVLTVGHLFWDRHRLPELNDEVRIRVTGNRQIQGRLVLRSDPGSPVDAAIVLVARQALVDGGVLRANASTAGKKIRSVARLSADAMKLGKTIPRSVPIGFQVLRYLPEFSLIQHLGPIQHALDVRSDVSGTFAKGTSGAAWIIARQAACQQFAGWESSSETNLSVGGIGQSMETILGWCRRQLATVYRRGASETDLRLIREL